MAHRLARDDAPRQGRDRDERDPRLHLVLEQLLVAADRDALGRHADPAARACALPVIPGGHDRRALRLLHHGAGARHPALPPCSEGVHPRPHLGGDQGMSDEDPDGPLWRRLLLNRFVLVPGAIAAAILAWNIYVASHDNGIVEGLVVDPKGEPVAGASVALWVLNFTTYVEHARMRTSADGRFRFDGNASHNIQLAAGGRGGRRGGGGPGRGAPHGRGAPAPRPGAAAARREERHKRRKGRAL